MYHQEISTGEVDNAMGNCYSVNFDASAMVDWRIILRLNHV